MKPSIVTKTKKPVLTVLVFSIMLVSCVSVKPTQNHIALHRWVDMYYVDAVYQLGKPSAVFIDGLKGRVLVYDSVLQLPNIATINSYDKEFEDQIFDLVWLDSDERRVPTRIAQYADLLYVNRDGIIYSYQSNKSDKDFRIRYEKAAIATGIITSILLVAIIITGEE